MDHKNIGYFSLIGWSARFLFGVSRFHSLGYLVAVIVQVVAEVAQLWVAALVVGEIGNLILSKGSADHLFILAGCSVLLMTIDKIAWSLLSYFERQVYIQGSGDIYRLFNRQLANLSVSQHNNPDTRKLIDRLEYEGYAWKPLNFAFELFYTSHATLRSFVSSTIIVTQLPFIVLLLVIGVVPILFVQRKSGEVGWGIWGDVGDSSRIFWNVSHHLKSKDGIEEIIPQQSAEYLLSRADHAIEQYTREARKVRRHYSLYEVLAGVFEMLMAGVSYFWLITRAVGGAIGFNSFIFLSSLIWQTLSSIRLVVTSVARSLELTPFMRDFVTFIQLENNMPMANTPVKLDNQPLTIEFRNVSFKYPRQKHYSLRDISLTITPGDHLALVGLNGAGKTTLIRLLLRFYDPTAGSVFVNGTDIRDVDLQTYYQHVGTLFQSFNKYPLEFMKNITLSDESDKKRYKQALDISGADEVLKTIKSQDTFLQPEFSDGTELSGGQWQRVAIARNIYAASDIYILDEPTSAIDALTEQKIFEKLYRELEGKSLITVSHRFNTVRHADTIVVLSEGAVTERGTHTELMKLKGLYYDMFTTQAEGYGDKWYT